MDEAKTMPQVAFVMNLAGSQGTETRSARIQHLVHLFHGHRLPATWVVADLECAKLLSAQHSASSFETEIAIPVEGAWSEADTPPSSFRRQLAERCAAIRAAANSEIGLVAGDPRTLRSRAALFAEQDIRGILSLEQDSSAKSSRPLPCGMWQLEMHFQIPQVRRLSQWFSGRRISTKQLVAAGRERSTTLIGIDTGKLGTSNARSLRSFEKLLREVSWAASRNQLTVTTVGEVVNELASQRAVKPQQSILRSAA